MTHSSFYWARKSFGFTLVELLVVITVIAILAALLFPVFASSRAKARQAACLSNEKQIGLALMQYSQDYDELGPQEQFGVYAAGTQYIWHDAIYSYIRSVAVFNCPNTAYPKGTGPVTGTYYHAGMTCLGVDAAHPLGYGINRNYFNGIADPNCPGSSPVARPIPTRHNFLELLIHLAATAAALSYRAFQHLPTRYF